MRHKWIRMNSSLPNLNVLMVDGKEAGFIEKPKNTKTDRNAWRVHLGVGDHNKFVGHRWSKADAQRLLESFCVGGVHGLNYGVR